MAPLIKAEFRKLRTVRSTYILSILAFVFIGFLSFWVMGYKGNPNSHSTIMDVTMTMSSTISVFIAIIGILLVGHEYRFSTIVYTLTASNSRTKVLLAKIVTMLCFALGLTIVVGLAGALLTWIGMSMRDVPNIPIPPQHFYYIDTIWRSLFNVLGFVMAGLLFAVLFRHVVGAVVTLMIVPVTAEGLLTLLLKDNGRYLPFTALQQVQTGAPVSPGKAALIFTGYLLVGWAIAWFLFLRRDAN